MRTPTRPRANACWARTAALLAPLAALACFNDNHGSSYQGHGPRFGLVIEAQRTDVDATHFLVDQATGDLWRLEAPGSGRGRWVRLADAPPDVTPLETESPEGEHEADDD